MNRIEEILNELEDYLDSCKVQTFSKNIIADRNYLNELIGDLRMEIPEDLDRYKRIIEHQDAIIADANAKAQKILNNATIQNNQLINENEIVIQAKEQAQQIIAQAQAQAQQMQDYATEQANSMREHILSYSDNLLEQVQTLIGNHVDTFQENYANFIYGLQDAYNAFDDAREQLQDNDAEEE